MVSYAENNIRLTPKWIELNITKRECVTYIEAPGEDSMCQCGRKKAEHGDFVKHQIRRGAWSPSVNTTTFSTDAYGTILFEGEHHPNKAHYVRVSYDTNPELVVQLMTYAWNLEMPKLIISVRGGSSNFEMPARLGRILQTGLVKAARNTGAWVFSSGLNSGAAKHLGTALNNDRWLGGSKRGKVVSVGIAPWGIIQNRSDLIGRNKERIYSPLELAKSKFLRLNPRHSNFLLVDNGSVGKFGGENYFRRRLEKCIASYPTSPNGGCDTPVVVVVIEGGFYTLRQISDYLYDEPPVPVVIFAGTGRSADLLAWLIKRVSSEEEYDTLKEEIYPKIIHSYRVSINQCAVLYEVIKHIFVRRNLITVFNPNSSTSEEDFDAVILSSIFRSQHWTPLQQLSLTLVWDRVDIAHAEVFIYGREWSREHLEHAMMEALVANRLDFVELLLEHGLNMQTFLTASRLEALYSLDRLPSKLMRTLLVEISKIHSPKHKEGLRKSANVKNLTLHDIGVALSHMIGHVYKSHYIHLVTKTLRRSGGTELLEEAGSQTFSHPFDDLFVWAVLTKRHEMSKLLWPHGQGALAKALVAVKLNKFLANEINSTEKTFTNMALDFEKYADEWENLSLSLLDSCYRSDNEMARQLLTMELDSWSKQTCLTLAVIATHRMLLGHACCQLLLADLWMGALNIKSNSTIKIVLGILFPPIVLFWEYKSTEELRMLPHQEKASTEHSGSIHVQADKDVNELEEDVQISLLTDTELGEQGILMKVRSNQSFAGTPFNPNEPVPILDRRTDLAEVASEILTNKVDGQHIVQLVQNTPSHPQPPSFPKQRLLVENEKMDLEHDARNVVVLDQRQVVEGNVHQNRIIANRVRYGGNAFQATDNRGFQQEYFRNKNSSFVTMQQSLTLWSKFIEFQRAPVTNFYRHAIAYFAFIIAIAYVILYPQNPNFPGWVEWFVIACFVTQFLECTREFINIEALGFAQKVTQMQKNVWQLGDVIAVTVCVFGGVGLRFTDDYFEHGMLVYRISSIYWNLRMYKYLGVHRFVGPKLQMMRRMLSHMLYFSMIIFVIIISFGVAREAIRFPDVHPTTRDLSEAFLEPYIMMFGEVDLDALSPQCRFNDEGAKHEGNHSGPTPTVIGDEYIGCPIGAWVVPIVWVVYMLVSNILIVNVLIAVFNGIYDEVDSIAVEVWMFQRFNFVMEFEQKPKLPPPFIILCHIWSIIKHIYSSFLTCMCEEELLESQLEDDDSPHIILGNDHSLKSFLSSGEQSMVFDFEEDNIDTLTPLLQKDINNAPNSLENVKDAAALHHIGTGSEKFSIQQTRLTLGDLHFEMDVQKGKLDKLINYWEVDAALNDKGEDDNREEEKSIIGGNGKNKIFEVMSSASSIDAFGK